MIQPTAEANFDTGFKLEYNDMAIIVKRHLIKDEEVYRIEFADKRKPLIVTQTMDVHQREFWTSIPQGRFSEALSIGKLIDRQIKI